MSKMLHQTRPAKGLGQLSKSLIGNELEEVEIILARTLAPYRRELGPLLKHLQHYKGKRLRPMLLLLVAHACGKVVPAHPILAAVVEMIHTATLVHDDVLDESETRRHVATVNAGWGNKTSILLGDLLFSTSFHLSSKVGDARACEWIGEATNRVCAGELRQTMERGNLHLNEDDYFAMIEGKTAALTECCGRLGAFYADADAEVVSQMAEFGRSLGIAFQIADDILDLAGSEQKAGKTLGTDLEQRKLTLPLIYHLERISADDAADLRSRLAEGTIDPKALFEVVRETGSLESAQMCARQHSERAANALSILPASPYRSMLEKIAGWSVQREA